MDLHIAELIVNAAIKQADELNIPSVVAIVDDGGNLKLLKRMDQAIFGSVDISINKAYTAAAANVSTLELGQLSQPGQPLFGLNTTNQCRYVIFGGGIPLTYNGQLIGAIGVSGGTVEQDVAVAEAGVKEFQTVYTTKF